ncbi:hypothetical protein PSHT_03762 [Puccinia striiformis]|uniref:Uncharacterized protein n=1 Tax=Puccinia striiformis TaxID=27350 RepID=A0A2S4WEK9_9BASI|nr:hypothetical protein PSHT_03762 [Puccinia striiformis]
MPSQQMNTAICWMMEEPDPVQETLQNLTDSDEEEPPKNTHGPSKDQKRFEGELKLHQDYLSAEPTYNDSDFKRRFRITKTLFTRIRQDLVEFDDYFLQKRVCDFFSRSFFMYLTGY